MLKLTPDQNKQTNRNTQRKKRKETNNTPEVQECLKKNIQTCLKIQSLKKLKIKSYSERLNRSEFRALQKVSKLKNSFLTAVEGSTEGPAEDRESECSSGGFKATTSESEEWKANKKSKEPYVRNNREHSRIEDIGFRTQKWTRKLSCSSGSDWDIQWREPLSWGDLTEGGKSWGRETKQVDENRPFVFR